MYSKLCSFFVAVLCSALVVAKSFYIDKQYNPNSIMAHSVQDVTTLFAKAGLTEAPNKEDATLVIYFLLERDTTTFTTLYDANTKHRQAFTINCTTNNQQYTIAIKSVSYKGLSNGLYYLLQNKLGFYFYHAKEFTIPTMDKITLYSFEEYISPRFDKIGFHIHAMHPLEITEALLDETTPNGKEDVKEYIDWLCRNGQNYFEFNLLSSINLDTWIPYMKEIVDYAHQRGIICGADLSFHMIQQRAFKLYKKFPASFRKKEKQIDSNIKKLMQIPWDVWNVELATTEFTHKNQEELYKQQKMLYTKLAKYNVKLTSRKHVVKDENLLSNTKTKKTSCTDMDSAYAIFIHTVMFYGLNDSSTPVYRNKDFSHLRNLLEESKKYRDTWYFPESAYWITFDNSVPMFLTSYLSTRLEDILYCDAQNINGHITFSSGWEWNYWLIDWSIARWCWNETTQTQQPFEYFKSIINDNAIIDFIEDVHQLQQTYIKDKQLIKVLTAQTITDEIGGKLNIEFHPRPEFSYQYILNDATLSELDFITQKYITQLDTFITKYYAIKNKLNSKIQDNKLINEMLLSLEITTLRALHRKYTLQYLTETRKNSIEKKQTANTLKILTQAKAVRKTALALVQKQEQHYRYPIEAIAQPKWSKTVYDFGYLYPVSNLHFWEREEWQARNNKWKFWQQNIWDVLKIIGIKK